jgi:hypothetical protein
MTGVYWEPKSRITIFDALVKIFSVWQSSNKVIPLCLVEALRIIKKLTVMMSQKEI